MACWMWAGNEANYPLLQYLSRRRFIYWSTPKLRREIEVGDHAWIWRQKKGSKLPPGVVAVGEVVELPVPKTEIAHPEYLEEDRWRVTPASDWKTGIEVYELRWTIERGMLEADTLGKMVPDLTILKVRGRGTVFRVSNQQHQQLQRLWEQRATS